jgi:hypothetical protein
MREALLGEVGRQLDHVSGPPEGSRDTWTMREDLPEGVTR